MLALLWTLYLLLTAALMFVVGSAGGGMTNATFRPAARLNLVMLVIGLTVLWPALRLCQALPAEGGLRAVRRDLVVLVLPTQALVWPQVWLAQWSLATVAALACVLAGWAVLVGAVLAWALGCGASQPVRFGERAGVPTGPARVGWMIAVLVLVLGGGMAVLLGLASSAGGGSPRWSWMLSPITSVFELTHDRPWIGLRARPAGLHWVMLGVLGVVCLVAWILASIRCAATHRRSTPPAAQRSADS